MTSLAAVWAHKAKVGLGMRNRKRQGEFVGLLPISNSALPKALRQKPHYLPLLENVWDRISNEGPGQVLGPYQWPRKFLLIPAWSPPKLGGQAFFLFPFPKSGKMKSSKLPS